MDPTHGEMHFSMSGVHFLWPNCFAIATHHKEAMSSQQHANMTGNSNMKPGRASLCLDCPIMFECMQVGPMHHTNMVYMKVMRRT